MATIRHQVLGLGRGIGKPKTGGGIAAHLTGGQSGFACGEPHNLIQVAKIGSGLSLDSTAMTQGAKVRHELLIVRRICRRPCRFHLPFLAQQ
jgi:hypothetical protein